MVPCSCQIGQIGAWLSKEIHLPWPVWTTTTALLGILPYRFSQFCRSSSSNTLSRPWSCTLTITRVAFHFKGFDVITKWGWDPVQFISPVQFIKIDDVVFIGLYWLTSSLRIPILHLKMLNAHLCCYVHLDAGPHQTSHRDLVSLDEMGLCSKKRVQQNKTCKFTLNKNTNPPLALWKVGWSIQVSAAGKKDMNSAPKQSWKYFKICHKIAWTTGWKSL